MANTLYSLFNRFRLTEVTGGKRMPGLDVLRSVAILLVLISHAEINYLVNFIPSKVSDCIFNMGGYIGVELFFVLSGFLIGRIMIDLFWKSAKFNFKTIGQFWVRRWLRTVPNYFLALIIYIIIYKANGGFDFYFHRYYFVFMQNFAWKQPYLFGVSWSLTVEEWFYILLPVSLLLFYFISGFKKKQALLITVLFFLIGEIFIRTIYSYQNQEVNWDDYLRKIVVFRLDSIIYGVGAALVYRFKPYWWKVAPGTFFVTGIALMIVSCMVLMNCIFWAANPNWLIKAFIFPLTSISIVLIFPFITLLKIKSPWVNSIFTWISLISYSLYISSEFMFMLTNLIYGNPSTINKAIVMVITFFCLCFIVATIQYRLFEKPITSLRDKVRL